MRRVLLLSAALLCLLTAGCTPGAEITLTTLTPAYQGQIYVGGAVVSPGYYPYRTQDTLLDLIRAAGGLVPGADPGQVHLSLGETGGAQRIDLNRAEAWLLAALPEVGETMARAIVAYRETVGPFRSVDDLLQVKGIGPATLEKIRPFITVGGG